MTTAVFLLAAAPWVALLIILGIRAPAVLVAAYAAILPYGSSVSLPVGLPSAFSTATTIMGLVTTGGLLAHLLVTGRRTRQLHAPLPWWLIFFALLLLTLAWSASPAETFDKLLVLASLLSLYALACLLRVERRDVEIVEAGLAISGAATGLYALALLATGRMHVAADGIPRFQTAGGGGEGGDPNITAAALILPMAVSLACGLRSDRSGLPRVGYLVSAALAATTITLTGSRGGLVAALAVVLVLAANDRRLVARLVYVGVPVAAVLVTFAGAADNLQNRLQQQTSSGRDLIWTIGLQACQDHCWRGTGWATFSTVYTEYFLRYPDTTRVRTSVNPHSIWLQVPVEGGVLASLALLGALGVTAWLVWRLPPAWRGPTLAGFIGLLITNSLLGNLDFKYFWMTLMYIAWVVIAHREDGLKTTPAPAASTQQSQSQAVEQGPSS